MLKTDYAAGVEGGDGGSGQMQREGAEIRISSGCEASGVCGWTGCGGGEKEESGLTRGQRSEPLDKESALG